MVSLRVQSVIRLFENVAPVSPSPDLFLLRRAGANARGPGPGCHIIALVMNQRNKNEQSDATTPGTLNTTTPQQIGLCIHGAMKVLPGTKFRYVFQGLFEDRGRARERAPKASENAWWRCDTKVARV